jgi:flagellar basal body-associated protein FliL
MADEIGALGTNSYSTDPAPRRPLMRWLSMLLFIGVVITLECGLAWWFFPQAASDAGGEEPAPVTTAAVVAPKEPDVGPLVEVDLQEFSVTSFQPVANTTWRVRFHLYGVVSEQELPAFQRAYAKNQNRIRDQILEIVRSSDVSDFADAALGLIKRKISAKVNELLGQPLLRGVVFSDFDFYEQ